MEPPELQDHGAGIRLRFPRPRDVTGITEAACESIAEISPWMAWCHPAYSRDEAELWVDSLPVSWRERTAFSFVAERVSDQKILGCCGLSHLNWQHQLANLGYWIRTTETGNGYATASALLLARWAFSELALTRLEILMGTENTQSQAVARKIHARYEGVLRNRLVLVDRIMDASCYSLIPRDLEEARSRLS